ncbi:BA75_04545T0 [Komagataella pastoris]|uniref:BA75_04545T0 n=1 Tax=Komagataella pastoris TaxID=4922 RepID=A0A1B2JI10_PICPA|nr:BA75_04545T0 [Komagataella pastoris]
MQSNSERDSSPSDSNSTIELQRSENEYDHLTNTIMEDLGQKLNRYKESQDMSSSHILHLPTEVLLLILSFVTSKTDLLSFMLTCRKFGDLVSGLLWFRPGISNAYVYKEMIRIMRIPPEKTFWDYKKFIRRLNLSLVSNLVEDEFLYAFSGCPNLERITLVNCSKVTADSVATILKDASNLQSIDLTGVLNITDGVYYSLARHCKKLQGLYAPGSMAVSKNAVYTLISNCPMLKRIKLSECVGVDDEIVVKLVRECKNLVELDLHGCIRVTDYALVVLFEELEYLREFKISMNDHITERCFLGLPNEPYLDKLRIIDFTSCSNVNDKLVIKLVQLAPKLRHIVLSKCTKITDSSLRALATLGKCLHYLHLGHCINITDFGVCHLLRNCHRLQYVDLACCQELTNDTLFELSQLPRLRRIGLVKCHNITDHGILYLANNRRSPDDTLERVHLSYCTQISIFPIYKLLMACRRLTHLSLTGIRDFLRSDITRFCRDPPNDFTQSQRDMFCVFSGDGVRKLRDHLSSLYHQQQQINRYVNSQNIGNLRDDGEALNEIFQYIANPATPGQLPPRVQELIEARRRNRNQEPIMTNIVNFPEQIRRLSLLPPEQQQALPQPIRQLIAQATASPLSFPLQDQEPQQQQQERGLGIPPVDNFSQVVDEGQEFDEDQEME